MIWKPGSRVIALSLVLVSGAAWAAPFGGGETAGTLSLMMLGVIALVGVRRLTSGR